MAALAVDDRPALLLLLLGARGRRHIAGGRGRGRGRPRKAHDGGRRRLVVAGLPGAGPGLLGGRHACHRSGGLDGRQRLPLALAAARRRRGRLLLRVRQRGGVGLVGRDGLPHQHGPHRLAREGAICFLLEISKLLF